MIASLKKVLELKYCIVLHCLIGILLNLLCILISLPWNPVTSLATAARPFHEQ